MKKKLDLTGSICEICGTAPADPEYPLKDIQAACRQCGAKNILGLFKYMYKHDIGAARKIIDASDTVRELVNGK